MEKQNFQNHRRFKPETRSNKIYNLSVVVFNLLAIANLCRALMISSGRVYALFFVLVGIAFVAGYFTFRSFSLKAQDRAIRAEENLRHFVLTGKLPDKNLTISQIIGLRFASDEEYLGLAERAVKENLSNTEIKKAVKNWKADNHRA